MYWGRQSNQHVRANVGEEFLEANWNPVSMNQNISSNGTYGFPAYGMEFKERPGFNNCSIGASCQNLQMNNEHSSSGNAKEKKRKGIADCSAMQPSASSRIQNASDQQMEVSSQPSRNFAEKAEKRISSKMQSKEDSSDGDDAKEDYVHVRAKRGQATNSHSLAERMRRKKISERMKLLQDLVPGCSKITGKAVMLDEIINYVQSLQRQVEFLSMKLATVNPELSFDIEQILSKEIMISQDRHLAFYGTDQGSSSLLTQYNHGIMPSEMMCKTSNPADHLPTAIHDISPMNQIPAVWDGLQNIPHMDFSPGVAAESSGNDAGAMKIEQ